MTASLLLTRLTAALRPKADAGEDQGPDLLKQFYSTLRVIYLATHSKNAGQPPNEKIDAKLKQLFEATPSWRGAYEIEQLLSLVMTEEQLDTELARRLEEAKGVQLTYVGKLEEQWGAANESNSTKAKRALLQRLLNDLQWFYSQRIQRRAARQKLGIRVSCLFLSAFLFFFLVLSIQFLAQPLATG